jgi:drug/metabolite transporter (DMT)-like permease
LSHSASRTTRTAALTVIAMLAFAANSLLCRLALRDGAIDPASFSTVRVVSGAMILALLAWPHWRRTGPPRADWRSAVALFGYMICFSFAYLSVNAGTGALILFGAVQLTMFAAASGAIASGLGYAIWYAALPGLKATSAATVQLSVPAIAAFGGVLLLAEPVTLRLVLASAATLGGVAIVLRRRAARE